MLPTMQGVCGGGGGGAASIHFPLRASNNKHENCQVIRSTVKLRLQVTRLSVSFY
jgi:hypothetical protein